MKKLFIHAIAVVLMAICRLVAQAQPNILQVEYFVDTDPGPGNATVIAITPATAISNQTFLVNTAGFSEGLHTLVLRAKDANGTWSLNSRLLFVKPFSPTISSTLQYAEYFVDADPGFGNATEITGIIGNTNINNATVSINTAALYEGLHTLVIRARDANGSWSLNNKLLFLSPAPMPTPAPVITLVEYFVDTDPGLGQAINLPVTASLNISNAPFIANLSSLLAGPHAVFIRAMNANGNWSLINRLDFTIEGYCPGSIISFTTDVNGIGHQWQVDVAGNGNFVDITDNANYSGANTATLSLTLPTSFNRYVYRCVTSNGPSSTFTIRFATTWTGIVSTAWENTSNWNCGSLPDANTDVLIGNNKTLIINNNAIIKSLTISKGSSIQVKTGTNFKITGQ